MVQAQSAWLSVMSTRECGWGSALGCNFVRTSEVVQAGDLVDM